MTHGTVVVVEVVVGAGTAAAMQTVQDGLLFGRPSLVRKMTGGCQKEPFEMALETGGKVGHGRLSHRHGIAHIEAKIRGNRLGWEHDVCVCVLLRLRLMTLMSDCSESASFCSIAISDEELVERGMNKISVHNDPLALMCCCGQSTRVKFYVEGEGRCRCF
jgi:hypothetical protein